MYFNYLVIFYFYYCRIWGRKIEDEESSLNTKSSKSNVKKRKSKSPESTDAIVPNLQGEDTVTDEASSSSGNTETALSSVEFDEGSFEFVIPSSSSMGSSTTEEDSKKKRSSSRGNTENTRQPTAAVRQQQLPPEVVFFGDPRRPPPSEAAQESRFHGSLLFWARHAYVAPVSSFDRATKVFPSVAATTTSSLRMSEPISYQNIFNRFLSVKDDLEMSKDFISANIDLVPSTLFLRALTAKKLRAQFENNLAEMESLKQVRSRYILAHDQLYFPLNIEIRKAETRAMTFIARSELTEFAKDWDEVETTLYFLTMLTARLTWDDKVRRLLDRIKKKVSETVDYMAEGVKRDLMTREFRRPGITSEIYTNATIVFASETPKLYKKVIPEVKVIFETYGLRTPAEIKRYI